ncbi:MAG: L,D-transpeptidase family protein [Bosea sp. (in: a-proteobacteria)]
MFKARFTGFALLAAACAAPAGHAWANQPAFGPNTYDRTLDALIAYEEIALRGAWTSLPGSSVGLKPGSTGPLVVALKKRLTIGGDLNAADAAGDTFDAPTSAALKRYQVRHGLSDTGIVGPLTLKSLNITVSTRLNQLTASLERLKGNGFQFASRYVVVNIPGASVEAVENGEVVQRHVAVVGRHDRQSPVIQAKIQSVNLNPTWTVPMSILKADIIPKMRADKTFLAKSHMRILGAGGQEVDPATINWATLTNPNFFVRQDPGPTNSLGQVRIDMPNSEAVYMHDTPKKELFRSDVRFHSSGCARVQGVKDLATWLLEGTEWTREAIDSEIAKGERKDIKLKKHVPVAWVYLTAWQGNDGVVQFRDDIYNLDTNQGIVTSTIQTRKAPKAASTKPAAPKVLTPKAIAPVQPVTASFTPQ